MYIREKIWKNIYQLTVIVVGWQNYKHFYTYMSNTSFL